MRSKAIHRNLNQQFPIAVRGDGPYIILDDGTRYLDASGGAAVSCLGHSYTPVIEAIQRQLSKLPYVHSSFFSTEPLEELAELLVAMSPPSFNSAYFVSGGSEAVEAAIMMARQFHLQSGRPNRRHIIGRKNSYHGMTMGALTVGDTHVRRQPYAPMLVDTIHVSPCFPYHGQRDGEALNDYTIRVADELEKAIQQCEPDSIAAFIAETVIGSNGGAVPPTPGYFKRVCEICDRHDIVLILDEVFCGTGRTGTMFAFEHEGITPDIAVIAKGLGAGYQPIGALVAADRIMEPIRRGAGALAHGHTYSGHAAACAGATAVLTAIRENNLFSRVTTQGAKLMAGLRDRFDDHPNVGDIRGTGLLQAVEFVKNRSTREPFDPSLRLHALLKTTTLANGLMCYPQGGTIDGVRGDHITLAPPFIIEDEHITEILDKLEQAIDDVFSELNIR